MKILVFTDGSANNIKKDKGGIGVYFSNKNLQKYNLSEQPKINKPTNQKMEILAVIRAIEIIAKEITNVNWDAIIYTDSMYVINIATKYASKWIKFGWKRLEGKKKKTIANLKLVKKLYSLSKLYEVKFQHVNSHKNEPKNKNSKEWKLWYGNYMADKFAKSAFLK